MKDELTKEKDNLFLIFNCNKLYEFENSNIIKYTNIYIRWDKIDGKI